MNGKEKTDFLIKQLTREHQIKSDLLEAAKGVLQTAQNWACCCEINGEGVNNPAAVAVRDLKAAIAKAEPKE